jgi:D-alanyl-D-alanine carboxypeptidase (penicillin-binding protein 5/6)
MWRRPSPAPCGRVLWALHPRRRMPVASTTKIMTAFLALERLRPQALVTVTSAAAHVPLVKKGLRPRERVRAWKLLEGLLI